MALKVDSKSLRDLMKARNKVSASKEINKSQPSANLPPPPPQPFIDLGLKPIPELKKKRPNEDLEECKVGLSKGNKQQKVIKDWRGRRSSSIESREDPLEADVRRPPHMWSPKLEIEGAPIAWDASVPNFQEEQASYIAEALEQPLLLPRDMDAYRCFKQLKLFLSLKRDLAMITQQVYVAEEWVKDARNEAKAEAQYQFEIEKTLGALREDQAKLSKQWKKVI